MKKMFVFLMAIALASLLTACGGSPKGAAESFFLDVSAGKIDKAMAFISPEEVKMMGEGKISAMLGMLQKKYAQDGGIDHVDFSNEKDEGSRYTANAVIYFKNGKSEKKNVTMEKIDGKWYIGK